MTARRILRRVARETLIESDEHLIDLPKLHDYRSLLVVLDGTLTVSGGTATSVPADSPCDLIQRVDLIANGKDVIHQSPFVFNVMGNYTRDWSEEKTAPGTSAAAHPVRAVGLIDLFTSDGVRPKDSAFQAYLSQLLQLRLTTGSADDIIVKGATTLAFAGTIDVILDSLLEPQRQQGESKAFKKTVTQSVTVSGANSALPLELPVSNSIRMIRIRATDDGAPTDTLIKTVSFNVDDVDVRTSMDWPELRAINQLDKYGQAPPAGFGVIDALVDGKLSNAYDLSGASKAELIFDVNAPSGTGKIEIVTDEYILPALG